MKKQERLNNLVLKMMRGEVKVKELAKLFNTTERTIQNDIKELSEIYEIVSPSRGVYKINFSYEVEKKFEEVFSKFVMKANYDMFPQFEDLIKKMEYKTGFKPTTAFEINFKLEELENSEILIDLFQAIEWNYGVEFNYENRKIILQPLKILNDQTLWYLIGFNLLENRIEHFRIKNMENLILKTENLIGNEVNKLKEEANKIKKIKS